MPGRCWLASRSAALIALIAMSPTIAYADAILPSLALIWPITILLLIPIVVVEALYSKSHLGMNFWESIRLMGVANIFVIHCWTSDCQPFIGWDCNMAWNGCISEIWTSCIKQQRDRVSA
jgi:hypothetical protein